MKKAYLAIKFHENSENKELIEQIHRSFANKGIIVRNMQRDVESWDKKRFEPKELMKRTFSEIDGCDILLAEISEKGVGIGIEAGYAHAKGKKVIILARHGSDIPQTLQGISEEIIIYKDINELENKIKNI